MNGTINHITLPALIERLGDCAQKRIADMSGFSESWISRNKTNENLVFVTSGDEISHYYLLKQVRPKK